MASKQKNKKSAPATAKESEMQQSEEAYANSVANQVIDTTEDPVSLEMILKELQAFRHDNNQKLEDIREEVAKANLRLDNAEERIVGNEDKLQRKGEALAEMLTMQEQLQMKLIDQEGWSRRENVRIYPRGGRRRPKDNDPIH